ncbi:hypothetical protein Tco_0602085 [Tanacetum coccineum]
MAIMNTGLNIEKLDEYIVQKHGGSKQVGFKQLGPRVEIGVHGVHDEKLVWFEVELHGAQGDREAEVFRLVMMTLHWLKDGWRTSNLKRRQTRTAWSTQQCMKSGVVKHLDVAGIEQQNGLVDETNVTLFAKVVLYRNMGFNESGEYKKTFIGSSVGTGSMQVLQGVEFEVEQHEDLTFEVEPHGNVDHVDEDMDVRSDVYVLSNGYRKSSDDNHDYYWEYAPAKGNVLGLEIIRDRRGECDVEKNGSLKANLQHMKALSTTEAGYVTFTEARKKETWLKGLLKESGYELRLVAGIATSALVKGYSRSEVPAQVKVVAYRY